VAPSAIPITRPVRLFADVVQPILTRRCGACHGGERHAGGFSIEDRASLFDSSRVVQGNPRASTLLARLASPLADEDHMPPRNKVQPTPGEIAAIEMWIARGASESLVVDASDLAPEIASVAQTPPPAAARKPAKQMSVVRPSRGGCAGCAVTKADDPGALAIGFGLVLLATCARRRQRQCGPDQGDQG
jgi:hypothetical protein